MTPQKILVCGLPGSGKTTFARRLAKIINAIHFNADEVRALLDDKDFSVEGRIRQSERMGGLCEMANRHGFHAVADLICPTRACRLHFNGDYIIFIDTITYSEFGDTDKIFERPDISAELGHGYSVRSHDQFYGALSDVSQNILSLSEINVHPNC